MPVVFSLLWGVLIGLASGGRLRGLAEARLRAPYMLLAAFLVQALARGRLLTPGATSWGVLLWAVASVTLIIVLLIQRESPTLGLVAIGIALNLLVVLLNGFMPIYAVEGLDPADVATALSADKGFYALGTRATLGAFLADGLALPFLGHHYLLSVGDVLLVCGASGFIVGSMLRANRPGSSIA